ncbi:MAG: SirB2 family protein [Gammaproteobacteria bacterium]|nr:SirB2 family protein [Gammaproteobacteria bacterium]
MTFYLLLKYLHIVCAVVSISGFLLRGLWLIQQSPMLQKHWVKKLPHKIDALLLFSALAMVYLSEQYPFVLDWLTVKVLMLIVYILLGMVALRWGKTRSIRITAWFLAVLCFFFIVSVALTRQPLGYLAG